MVRKKTESEINKELALKAIKKAAKTFSWNLDYSLAEIFLPIVEEYIINATKTIEIGWYEMSNFQKRIIFKVDQNKFLRKLFHKWTKKYISYKNKDVKRKLELVADTLKDILKDDEKYLLKRWDIKPLARVKFNHIPEYVTNKDGKKEKMYRLEVAKGYEKAEEYNRKIVLHNNKMDLKRVKWQKKNLKWFVTYLHELWW